MQKHQRITRHHLHGIRVILFSFLIISLFAVRINPASISATTNTESVLAYATSMSQSGLLQATNNYRAQNGLGPLLLNGQLNSSSQAKAQHMVDNNYWAHTAPDGTEPWFFFGQAGYNYTTAGENLAYGFTTSEAVVDGWINSPSHRANIVGSYADVGFGYVNGASYQGGNNTVVVAHYGSQASSTPPAPPAPPAAPVSPVAPPAAPPSTPVIPDPSTPNNEPPPASETPIAANIQNEQAALKTPPSEAKKTSVSKEIKPVSVIQQLRSGSIPPLAIASLGLLSVSAVGFVLTHRALIRQTLREGRRFVVHHPAFDAAAVFTVTVLILTTTVGYIG